VDRLYHFVQEFIEDGIIKIGFVLSADIDSDLFTKNVHQESYEKHTKKFLKDSEVHITVPVDCYRKGRLLEISFVINNLGLHV
jgi:hypothetical protein